jgi:hypothetical protein
MGEGVSKVNPKILKEAEKVTQTDVIFTPNLVKQRGGRLKRLLSLRRWLLEPFGF